MSVHHQTETVTLHHGDCLDVIRDLPDNSVDSIVTDPPYGLGFMGKAWDVGAIAFNPVLWKEALRVLKPGGHMVAFGGTRTWHRLAVAIEDAGFEIRDNLAWLYGSGFPKSLDVGKAIDKAAGAEREVIGKYRSPEGTSGGKGRKFCHGVQELDGLPDITAPATDAAKQWHGWGTALKPAFEPIVLARKPFRGTVAGNVLEHGVGALNVDGCRVAATDGYPENSVTQGVNTAKSSYAPAQTRQTFAPSDAGRWPANVLLDPAAAAEVDEQSGVSKSTPAVGIKRRGRSAGIMGEVGELRDGRPEGHADSGGASRFFPTFRYQAKAPTKERPDVNGVRHPTVKPLALMQWLVRLITPPGGTVLEPFAGSGATVEACLLEGFACVAIERESEYMPLIVSRIERAS